MPDKGKEIKKEVKLVALKEPIQVPYDGNIHKINRIILPQTYTISHTPFINISHIGDINPTTQTVTVVTDYGDIWVIPVDNITNIVYGTSELKETTPEIKSNRLDSMITGANTILVDTTRLKVNNVNDNSSHEEHYSEVTFPSNTTIEGKKISSKGEDPKPKFIKRQDRLYPTEPINAYEFFKNNQEQLSHGNYPFNAGIYKSTLQRNDRATHALVLDNAHIDVNELEQAFLAPISLHELTYKKLLYVTQDDKGNYVMVMDTSTDWDNPNYKGLDPELFK